MPTHTSGETIWVDIDFSVLTEEHYDDVCCLLQFHNLTKKDVFVEDVSVTDTKISMFKNYSFCIVDTLVVVSTPTTPAAAPPAPAPPTTSSTMENNTWETRNLNVILYAKGHVVSMHRGPMQGTIQEMYARITMHHNGSIPSADWIQWAAFDCLLGSLIHHIDATVSIVERIDRTSIPIDLDLEHNNQQLNRSGILRDISVARKRLGKLKNSLSSKMETLSVIIQQAKSKMVQQPLLKESMLVHLTALESEVKWKMARVSASSDTLQSAYQNYLAFVSVRAAYINNQANSVLKKITMLLAITSPLNLIASIFGMNVYPLTQVNVVDEGVDNYVLFVLLLIVMFVSSFGLLCTAKRYQWL